MAVAAPPLSPRQAEMLACIRAYRAQHRISPTVRELADLMRIRSHNGVMSVVKPLVRKGFLTYSPCTARSIVPTGETESESAPAALPPIDPDRLGTLTKQQRAVYLYIRECLERRGVGPTYRDIIEHFGFRSPNAANCHLKALKRKGMIRNSHNVSRSIVVL